MAQIRKQYYYVYKLEGNDNVYCASISFFHDRHYNAFLLTYQGHYLYEFIKNVPLSCIKKQYSAKDIDDMNRGYALFWPKSK